MKTKQTVKILVSIGVIVLVLFAVSVILKSKVETKPKEVSPYLNSKIEAKTFQEKGTWGYDIIIDGKIYVHQPNIPALAGDAGFKSEDDAKKVAELVIIKIRDNVLPPSVTTDELKKFGIE